jgi:hypothetical protein
VVLASLLPLRKHDPLQLPAADQAAYDTVLTCSFAVVNGSWDFQRGFVNVFVGASFCHSETAELSKQASCRFTSCAI